MVMTKEQKAAYYKKNKHKWKGYARTRLARRKIWFMGIKSQYSCIQCGESDPRCIDFHHRDASNKVFTISNVATSYSQERILAEIEKCDPLCANCHRKLHCLTPNLGVVDSESEANM